MEPVTVGIQDVQHLLQGIINSSIKKYKNIVDIHNMKCYYTNVVNKNEAEYPLSPMHA